MLKKGVYLKQILNNINRYVFILIPFFLCLNTVVAQNLTRQNYIEKYSGIAVKEMKRSGVPASITLAQGMLESDNGNSTLARKANNHFGIKCHKDWTGETYTHNDDRPNECFRKYKNADQSFYDHSDFLLKHTRYAFLFDLDPMDYQGWCKGLKEAGYATNKHYDKLLIKIIEDNQLHQFDDSDFKPLVKPKLAEKGTSSQINEDENTINPFGTEIQQINRIDYVIAKQGDTYETIAEKQGLMAWQLYKYNEATQGVQPMEGDHVFLQPKRRKAEINNKSHIVKPGETMYSISQRYGIKMKHLYRINAMRYGYQPEIGNSISLRKKVKRVN